MQRLILLNPYFFQLLAQFHRDRKYILSTSGRPPSPWERWERSGRGSYRHISSPSPNCSTISPAPPQHIQPPTLPISFPFFFCQGVGKAQFDDGERGKRRLCERTKVNVSVSAFEAVGKLVHLFLGCWWVGGTVVGLLEAWWVRLCGQLGGWG